LLHAALTLFFREQEVAPRADTKGGYFVPWVWKK
jgi:hypothetical protein